MTRVKSYEGGITSPEAAWRFGQRHKYDVIEFPRCVWDPGLVYPDKPKDLNALTVLCCEHDHMPCIQDGAKTADIHIFAEKDTGLGWTLFCIAGALYPEMRAWRISDRHYKTNGDRYIFSAKVQFLPRDFDESGFMNSPEVMDLMNVKAAEALRQADLRQWLWDTCRREANQTAAFMSAVVGILSLPKEDKKTDPSLLDDPVGDSSLVWRNGSIRLIEKGEETHQGLEAMSKWYRIRTHRF